MSSSSAHVAKEHFTAEEQRILEQLGVHKSKPSGGKRKVSAQLLTPPRSLSGSSNSSSTASFRFKKRVGLSTLEDFDLPTDSESVAALEFMGFEPVTAKAIFQTWEGREEEYPYDLVDHSFGGIENKSQGDLAYADFMSKVGLRKEFQDAILDPRFADMFQTETLKYWIRDTLASRHDTIEVLNARCHDMAMTLRGGGGHENKKARLSQPEDSSNVVAVNPNETASLSGGAPKLAFPQAHIRIGTPSSTLPDHYTLYMGRTAYLDVADPLIAADGSLVLSVLDTPAGGDFNGRHLASYWTLEEETAELYQTWAARRNLAGETWLVSIQVPKACIATLRRASLWYSRDWKEYVWLCRKKSVQIPSKFDNLENAQLIDGHICYKLQHLMARINRENVQTTVTEDFLLCYRAANGNLVRSTQWAFMGKSTMVQLSKAVQGKLHIDVHEGTALKEE